MHFSFFDDFPRKYICAANEIVKSGYTLAARTNGTDLDSRIHKYLRMPPGSRPYTINPFFGMVKDRLKSLDVYEDLSRMFNVSNDTIRVVSAFAQTGSSGYSLNNDEMVFAANLGLLINVVIFKGYYEPDYNYLRSKSKYNFENFKL